MNTLEIRAGDAAYDVVIGAGLRAEAPALLAAHGIAASGTVVISNTTVAPLYGEAMAEALGAPLLAMPDGEQYKTLETLGTLCEDMLAAGMDRQGLVVAVGGGVVGDVAGLAAALYMRGVRVVQVPTTVLAMVDASVGGKTAVDLPGGKNSVGAFWQPALVIIDPETLETLAEAEKRAGLAEVLKHGLIGDPDLFAQLESGAFRVDAPLLAQAVAVKARVVAEDVHEHGVRAKLNLGHTFGHAVEVVSGYTWRHGEAVAAGLVAAARLSARLGLCEAALPARVERAVARLALPTRFGALAPPALWEAMGTDKKWRGGRSRFVLLCGIGDVCVMEGIAREAVMPVLEAMCE